MKKEHKIYFGIMGTLTAGAIAATLTIFPTQQEYEYRQSLLEQAIQKADTNRDGVLQTKETAWMLREMGYNGTLHEGVRYELVVYDTPDIKIERRDPLEGTYYQVSLPESELEEFIEEHK